LAFFNILAAGAYGIVMGVDRSRGFLGVTPLVSAYAHAHLAAVGWVAMMVVGLSYRLIPMMLPAAMPTGSAIALSAVLLECGLAIVIAALLSGSDWLVAGALVILGGLASFVTQIRRAVRHRMPRPPALPRRDWSTWQTHTALLWLLVSAVLGTALVVGVPADWTTPLTWIYGVAALVGFLAQIVVGMQGRLVPFYAWYRAFAAAGGTRSSRETFFCSGRPGCRCSRSVSQAKRGGLFQVAPRCCSRDWRPARRTSVTCCSKRRRHDEEVESRNGGSRGVAVSSHGVSAL
jgi:hypothetical protein